MKTNLWKKTAAIFALSFGALFAPPAWAKCDLCSLARTGNLAEVQNHLDNRAEMPVDINGTDKKGRTALFWATKKNHTEIAELLLNDPDDPADVNISNLLGLTPLMLAAENGNMALVEILVGSGADVNLSGGFNDQTALELASENGHTEIAEYIVQNGADCPNETVRIGDSCINPPECGDNMVQDGPACVCVNGFVPDNSGGCEECGHNEVQIGEECTCGSGYEWIGDYCAPTIENCNEFDQVRNPETLECESCPPNTNQEGNSCIPQCGENEVADGDSCVCVDGYERNSSGVCEMQCGENEMPGGEECICVDGYEPVEGFGCLLNCNPETEERINDECVPVLQCGENEVVNDEGNSCVCVDGHVRDPQTGICRLDINPSPEVCNARGERFVNGECEPCADDTELHENENRCIHTMESCNAQGLVLYEDSNGVSSCVTEEESCRFNDKVLRDGECVECGTDYKRHFNACHPINPAPCNAKDEIYIPNPGADDGRCEACPEGANREGNECVLTEEYCRSQDMVLRDGECEMCGDEYRRHFNECWPIVEGPCNAKNTIFIPDPPRLAWVCDSCPEGMNADPATNTCVPASAN